MQETGCGPPASSLRGELRNFGRQRPTRGSFLRSLTQRGQELLRETGHSADPKRIVGTLRAPQWIRRSRAARAGTIERRPRRRAGSMLSQGWSSRPGRTGGESAEETSPATQRRDRSGSEAAREPQRRRRKDTAKATRAAARAEASLAEHARTPCRTNEALQHAQTELETSRPSNRGVGNRPGVTRR